MKKYIEKNTSFEIVKVSKPELLELSIIFRKWIRHQKTWNGDINSKPYTTDELIDFLYDKYNN